MKKITQIMMTILALSVLSFNADASEKTMELHVAFAGPDLNSLTQSTVSLLKASGRTIKSINIISTFGTGRPAGVRIVHTEAAPVPPSCRVAQQSFAVNFLTNFFVRANETLGYLKMANKQVIDFQYTSFFGTGKPAAGQFLYCL